MDSWIKWVEMMIDDFEDAEEHVLELCALDKSKAPPARSIEHPQWAQIDRAIDQVYIHGGFVYVRVLKPENSYIKELCMESLPRQFRIITLTRDENPKNELLEWWEPQAAGFRGTIRFGDDEWDARTVCSELAVAQKFFYELYEYGKLSHETLLNLRSQWNPIP
jgi:hypothetical protein